MTGAGMGGAAGGLTTGPKSARPTRAPTKPTRSLFIRSDHEPLGSPRGANDRVARDAGVGAVLQGGQHGLVPAVAQRGHGSCETAVPVHVRLDARAVAGDRLGARLRL